LNVSQLHILKLAQQMLSNLYFTLKNSNIFKSSFIYLLANIANASVPFLLLPFLTRLLTLEQYGNIGLFQAALTALIIVVGMGGHEAIRVKYFKSNNNEYRGVLNSVIVIFAVSFIVTTMIVCCLKGVLQEYTNLHFNVYLLAVAGAASRFLVTLRLAYWQVSDEPRKYGLYLIGITIFNAALTLILIAVVDLGEYGRYFGVVIPTLVFGLFGLASLYKIVGYSRPVVEYSAIKNLASFTFPMVPHALLLALVASVDRFAISNSGGNSSAGIYFLAFQLAMPMMIIGNSINLAFKPWSYKNMAKGHHSKVVLATYLIMLFMLSLSAVYSVSVYLLESFILGSEYVGNFNIIVLLIFSGAFTALQQAVGKGVSFAEKTKVLSLFSVPLSSVYLFAVFFIALKFGIVGVAMAQLAFRILMFFLVWAVSMKVIKQPWFSF